jgi:hypothetical protein
MDGFDDGDRGVVMTEFRPYNPSLQLARKMDAWHACEGARRSFGNRLFSREPNISSSR